MHGMWAALIIIGLSKGLELFIVPHSHCDPGWIEPVDWYYDNKVKHILNSIMTLLEEDNSRKFVWSETSFLKMWMDYQPEKVKSKFKDYVKKGRIEIVGGGYVQHDEASTDIEMIIRQIDHGHQYLKKEFGIDKVKVGWQIDPFGHSALTPSLFSKFGFEYLVINRINVEFKKQLINDGDLEFIWKGTNLGDEESIFTHLLYDHYDPPLFLHPKKPGNWYDSRKPIEQFANALYNLVIERSKSYKTDKIMLLYGEDFLFDQIAVARELYQRIEKLRDYMNENIFDLEVKITTAGEYFEAVKNSNAKFSIYTGDFLPYHSHRPTNEEAYWTGHYSTRPALKQAIYYTQGLVRAAEIAKSVIKSESYYGYDASLTLHHDGITGTCRPHVAQDYMMRIENEQKNANQAIMETIKTMFTKTTQNYWLMLPYRVLIVYNPLNWDKISLLSIKSHTANMEILNWDGYSIDSQSVEGKTEKNDKWTIYFKVKLPALSFASLFVTEHPSHCKYCAKLSTLNHDNILRDNVYRIEFNNLGLVNKISVIGKGTYNFVQELWSYSGDKGGAYIFHPTNQGNSMSDTSLISIEILNGPVAQIAEIIWRRRTTQNEYQNYYQKIILYGEKRFIWTYGFYSVLNEEILVRFTSDDISEKNWLLTSNSGDLRIRKYFKNDNPGKKGSNMYPTPGGFAIKLGNEYINFFSKFSLGVGIVNQKSFEILMHRSLANDDTFGLVMGVDDKTFVKYHYEIEIGELFAYNYKRAYVEAKTDVFSFWVQNINDFSLTIEKEKAYEFTDDWEYNSLYLLGLNNTDVYLSSATISNDNLNFRLWNLHDSSKGITFENFTFIDKNKKILNGNTNILTHHFWTKNNKEIDFKLKPETGKAYKFIQNSKDTPIGEVTLKPYEFSDFYVRKIESLFNVDSSLSKENPFNEIDFNKNAKITSGLFLNPQSGEL